MVRLPSGWHRGFADRLPHRQTWRSMAPAISASLASGFSRSRATPSRTSPGAYRIASRPARGSLLDGMEPPFLFDHSMVVMLAPATEVASSRQDRRRPSADEHGAGTGTDFAAGRTWFPSGPSRPGARRAALGRLGTSTGRRAPFTVSSTLASSAPSLYRHPAEPRWPQEKSRPSRDIESFSSANASPWLNFPKRGHVRY